MSPFSTALDPRPDTSVQLIPYGSGSGGGKGGGVSTVCVLVNGEVMHGGRRAWPGGSEGVYARAQGSCLGPEQIQLAPKAGTPCPDQSDRLRRNYWSDSSRTIYTDVDHYRQAQTQPETQSCRLVHRTGLCIDYQAKKMLRWKCQSQYQVQHCHKDGRFLLKCCNSTFFGWWCVQGCHFK